MEPEPIIQAPAVQNCVGTGSTGLVARIVSTAAEVLCHVALHRHIDRSHPCTTVVSIMCIGAFVAVDAETQRKERQV